MKNTRRDKVVQAAAVTGDVSLITPKGARSTLSKMKNSKAVGPNEIPVEAWK